MYATETYVRHEVRELHAMIKDMANDLGGDIRYLNQEIINLSERLTMLETQIENLRQQVDNWTTRLFNYYIKKTFSMQAHIKNKLC